MKKLKIYVQIFQFISLQEDIMRCPFSGKDDTQVKESRASDDGGSIRRRRLCTSCGSRFTTFERIQLRELTVIKRNGK